MYRIKDWNKTYENAKSRDVENCSFVCMPNGQDGMGFTRIMAEPDGRNIYGIFCLIAGTCSRQRKRDGYLTVDGLENGDPWTLEDMALIWRATTEEIERALTFLSSPKIGWLEHLECKYPLTAAALPAQYPRTTAALPPHYPLTALKEGRKEGKKEREFSDSEKRLAAESDNGDLVSALPLAPLVIAPEDQWHLARLERWAVLLSPIVGKVPLANNWQEYKRLADKYGAEVVANLADSKPPGERWPNKLEPDLIAIAVSSLPVWRSSHDLAQIAICDRATEIVALRGWKACVDKTGLSGVSSEEETLVECRENPGFASELVAWESGAASAN